MTNSVAFTTVVDDIDDEALDDAVKKRLGFGFWVAISWIGLVSLAALLDVEVRVDRDPDLALSTERPLELELGLDRQGLELQGLAHEAISLTELPLLLLPPGSI